MRRRAAFDMRGISLRNVPVSRSSSVPPRGRFSVFRVCRRRNLRHQRVDWTYRGQPDGDAARCGQDNWVEADTHPCAAPGARRPNGAHTRPGARRTCAAPGAGRPNGAHTHGPAREGSAPPSARDVSTGHTRTARRGTSPPFFFSIISAQSTRSAWRRGGTEEGRGKTLSRLHSDLDSSNEGMRIQCVINSISRMRSGDCPQCDHRESVRVGQPRLLHLVVFLLWDCSRTVWRKGVHV